MTGRNHDGELLEALVRSWVAAEEAAHLVGRFAP